MGQKTRHSRSMGRLRDISRRSASMADRVLCSESYTWGPLRTCLILYAIMPHNIRAVLDRSSFPLVSLRPLKRPFQLNGRRYRIVVPRTSASRFIDAGIPHDRGDEGPHAQHQCRVHILLSVLRGNVQRVGDDKRDDVPSKQAGKNAKRMITNRKNAA